MYVLELVGEDDAFAAREAGSVCTGVKPLAPGLAKARGVGSIEQLAFTRVVSRLIGTCTPTVPAAERLLKTASIDRSGSVAVRVRNVRGSTDVSTREAERTLGRVLDDRGFTVDLETPEHELRALFARGTVPAEKEAPDVEERAVCALGWLEREREGGFGARKPTEKPYFQPGSMGPLLARALANLAGAASGAIVADPMCGTGGVLVEAGLVGADVVGIDAQQKMVRGTRENLRHYLSGDIGRLVRADATRLPLHDDTVDGVVFDAPYGRQSHVASRSIEELVTGALAEAYRIAPRAVVMGDRPLARAAREQGWIVESTFERRVHRSLVRHIHVLNRH